MFNNVNRLNLSFPINNAVQNKNKLFPQLIPLGRQVHLKLKWHQRHAPEAV